MGTTPEEFTEQVLEASHHTPVLVDFWAPWCGPCRVLGPILDKLASECAGQWRLFKVNTDESQEVSTSYRIRGIPAVKLFVEGAVVGEFTGALSEPMVRRWLEEHLPTPGRAALGEALPLLAAGKTDQAAGILRPALADEPTCDELRIRLAQALALTDTQEAAELSDPLPDDVDLSMIAKAIQTIAKFHTYDPASLPPGRGRTHFEDVLQALRAKDHEAVLLRLIGVLQHDRYYLSDAAREFGIAFFTLLGTDHPLTRKHRRTFDMWLY